MLEVGQAAGAPVVEQDSKISVMANNSVSSNRVDEHIPSGDIKRGNSQSVMSFARLNELRPESGVREKDYSGVLNDI